jgi:hypothetical protein
MRSLDIWLGSYIRQRLARMISRASKRAPRHLLFCMVDHFEPIACGSSTVEGERKRMQAWTERYPTLARRHRDSDGVPPQHTWFYPAENYRAEYLDRLSELCGQGLGEIELHLHHGHDSVASLQQLLVEAVERFNRHGALITQGEPSIKTYAFIHGNLALDNSMGDPRLCGVNSELDILQRTGCYADFSMPTAPARSQTRKINAIYYAVDDPNAPKSHNTGVDAEAGKKDVDGLLIIQGPLALDWKKRKFGVLPRIDNGHISGNYLGTPDRTLRWMRQNIHVKGRPEWVVVKISCHGAEEEHAGALLGEAADRMHAYLEARFRDCEDYRLHYVTARELYNIIKAAEAGCEGDPGAYRDFLIAPYLNRPVATFRDSGNRGH